MNTNTIIRLFIRTSATLLFFALTADGFARQNNLLVTIEPVAEDQNLPKIITDGNGGMLIFWLDGRDDRESIFWQKLAADGSPTYRGGTPLLKGTALIAAFDVTPAKGGGFFIAWEEITSNRRHSIFLQRFGPEGGSWATPIEVDNNLRSQTTPRIKNDDSEGVYLVWEDRSLISVPTIQPHAIKAQRIDENGKLVWDSDGIDLVSQAANFTLGDIVSVQDALIVVWENSRDRKIYMRALHDIDGSSFSDAPFEVSGSAAQMRNPKLSLAENKNDPENTDIFVVWEQQGESIDLHAQKIDLAGDKKWTANGRTVNTESGDQINHAIIDDGNENLFVIWQDSRDGPFKVYAQKLNSGGSKRFSNAGLALSDGGGSGNQINPQVVLNREGGIYCAWEDDRNGDLDIYAQSVSSSGSLGWRASDQVGVPVAVHKGVQTNISALVRDDNSLALVWEDARNRDLDLYAQVVLADGALDNISPRITSAPDTLASSGELYTYQVQAVDFDNDLPLAFSLLTAPDWLQIDNVSGLISGTPSVSDASAAAEVGVQVADNRAATVEQKYTLTITVDNSPPTITSQPVTSIDEDETYLYQIRFEDPDAGDTHTFVADTLPSWLNLATDTGLLTGTPTNDDVGASRVAVRVRDQIGASVSQAYTLRVINTNDPPFFTSTPDTFAVVDSLYRYAPKVDDVDPGDELQVSYLLGPEWAAWDEGSRILSGTPTIAHSGESQQVLLEVADLAGAQVLQSFNIHVELDTSADSTAPGAPTVLFLTQKGWTDGEAVTLNWRTPSDRTGIANAFIKIAATPENASDFDIRHEVRAQTGEADSATFSVDVEGHVPIYLWFEDGAGNIDIDNAASLLVAVDKSAPIAPIAIFPRAWSREDTVRFVWEKATDTGSGIKNYRLFVEPQIFQGIVMPVENAANQLETALTLNIDGKLSKLFRWYVVATDSADNQASSDTASFALDTTLPLLIHAPADTIPLAQSLTIRANVTDLLSGVAGVEIWYRPVGAASTQRQNLSQTSDSDYAITIPATMIQPQGFEYVLVASDSAGNRQFLQSNSALSPFRSVIIRGTNLGAPTATQENRYQIVSVPYAVPDFSLRDFFESSFGTYDDRRWRILRWQEPDGYFELTSDSIETLRPGRAFWLITRSSQAWKTGTVHSVSTAQPYRIPLNPGWNMIATPFAFDTDWRSVALPTGVQPILWEFTGNGYEMEQNTLQSWRGYFIENQSSITQELFISPVVTAAASAKQASLWSDMDWVLQLQAGYQDLHDRANYLGIGAAVGHDLTALQLSEPPAIGKTPRLYFVPDAQQSRAGQATAFRSLSAGDFAWDFVVENLHAGPLALSFSEIKALPDSLACILYDRTTGTRREIRQDEQAVSNIAAGETKRAFTLSLVAKQKARQELALPQNLALHPAWPNPYKRSSGKNIVFRFALPRPSTIELRVYNILGQEMYRSAIAADLFAGEHAFTWNGRRQDNVPVAAGLYFISLHIDRTQRLLQKMLVID